MTAIEEKLRQIQSEVLDEQGKKGGFQLKVRYFMIFFLMGGGQEVRALLEEKLVAALNSRSTFAILDANSTDSGELGRQVEAKLETAAGQYALVQDLTHVVLCPVLFPESCRIADMWEHFRCVADTLQRLGKHSVWQPFLLFRNKTEDYPAIYRSVMAVEDFLKKMLASPEGGQANRCCLLSDQDETGFAFPQERMLQTVVLTTVFQNIDLTQLKRADENAAATIASRAAVRGNEDDKELFFTTRSVTLANPVRIYTLRRILCALDWCFGVTDDSAKDVLANMEFSFLGDIIRQAAAALPSLDGRVSYLPLCAVMEGEHFEKRLGQAAVQYYIKPVRVDGWDDKVRQAVAAFFHNFFANNGSLARLEKSIEDGRLLSMMQNDAMLPSVDFRPAEPSRKLQKRLFSPQKRTYIDLQRQCVEKLMRTPAELRDAMAKELTKKETLDRIRSVNASVEAMRQAIGEELERLRQRSEMELIVGGGETITDPQEIQKEWFRNWDEKGKPEFRSIDRQFDSCVAQLLAGKADDGSQLLELCYQAVRSSIGTDHAYMESLGQECSRNAEKPGEYVGQIRRQWLFSIRFIGGAVAGGKDSVCLVGDGSTAACQKLKEKLDEGEKAALLSFAGLDRIDVLRVSPTFAPEQMVQWPMIARDGRAAEGGRA